MPGEDCVMPPAHIVVESPVVETARVCQVRGIFDLPPENGLKQVEGDLGSSGRSLEIAPVCRGNLVDREARQLKGCEEFREIVGRRNWVRHALFLLYVKHCCTAAASGL